MGRKIAIVTDSISCIPEMQLKEYNIREVPLNITFGNKVYRDRIDLKADEFYSMLKQFKQMPTTATPAPGYFLEAYQEAGKEADSIVCITLSSNLSGTYNSARIAAGMLKETIPDMNIEVIDSRTAAAAEGFVVLAASRAAASGKDMDEVINAAEYVMGKVYFFGALDTLEYLIKGGHIPKLAGLAGELLDIKPIIILKDGEAQAASIARTHAGVIKQLVEMTKKRIVKDLPIHVAVIHAAAPEKAEELKNRISSSFDCAELMVTDLTPVMGAHTGPGVIGLAFYCGEH